MTRNYSLLPATGTRRGLVADYVIRLVSNNALCVQLCDSVSILAVLNRYLCFLSSASITFFSCTILFLSFLHGCSLLSSLIYSFFFVSCFIDPFSLSLFCPFDPPLSFPVIASTLKPCSVSHRLFVAHTHAYNS